MRIGLTGVGRIGAFHAATLDSLDAVDELEEGLRRPEAPHSAQQTGAGVLEGDVVPRRDPGRSGHRLEQAGPDLGGLDGFFIVRLIAP